ncbi:ABC transporter permease [Thermatribacter velox]|uniref:Autoinducer 2 import system permease protein LsrD n=1 Tax=Thermatribacter velox TaxID=3039681 RepID=A0ABZ2YGA1_9BACT
MSRESQTRTWQRLLLSRSSGVLSALILVLIIFSFFSPEHRFVDPDNLKVLLSLGAEFSIIALGVGMLMVCGEFDLSIGSVLVFCSFIFLKLFELQWNPFAITAVTIAVGGLLGLINGLITVRGQIPSFVTTLGTMMFWRGLTILLSGGEQVACDVSTMETPAANYFLSVFTGKINNFMPAQFLWFSLFAVVLGIILHYHRFGNWVYATGDNKDAARAMGINTDMVKVICFIIVGILCGFVACAQIGRLACFTSRTGDGWELKAVAACVIGGTSLRGGIGSMTGIFLGAVIISVIENGLVVLRIPYFWTYVVFGLVILFSVLSSMYIEKKLMEIHQ